LELPPLLFLAKHQVFAFFITQVKHMPGLVEKGVNNAASAAVMIATKSCRAS